MNLKQTGRSMIEMLGVLAIIGVLSIGGMSMYRKAILNYRLGQTQHWIENVRFIIAEACANGNQNGCFANTNYTTDYKKRADYVCSQGGTAICPAGWHTVHGSVRTPLQEQLILMYMDSSLNYIRFFVSGLDKRTCEAVIDYDWNGLVQISNYANPGYNVQSGKKHLTQEQKDALKSDCPFPEYISLIFDLKS